MPGALAIVLALLGAVPQAELVAALRSAELLLYPCLFREAGCIVVQMALAAGTPPLTSDIACLPEYVGDCGVVVPGNPRPGGREAARRYRPPAVVKDEVKTLSR